MTQPPSGREERRRIRAPRKDFESVILARCLWDLFNSLADTARNSAELQVLGAWWDEHKHELEQILRRKGP